MFRDRYKHMCDQVHPDNDLIDHVLRSTRRGKRKGNTKVTFFRKPVIAVLSICLCIFIAVPALAATVEPVYQLMYAISPGAAQLFVPVRRSAEDNGIEMEVVSAYIHGNRAEIYIAMRDLTEDRIDDTIDLFDSYSLHRPFDSSAWCRRVEYDESTKTATFLITIDEWGHKKIAGDKITFSVKEFLSRKTFYEDINIPIDLSSIDAATTTENMYMTGWGAVDEEDIPEHMTALMPSGPMPAFPVDGIEMTAIGYVGGMLHIQTAVHDNLEKDNHGSLYLKEADGEIVDEKYHFYFIDESAPVRIDYCEYVFDIPREEAGGCSLYGDFVTTGMRTEGNWRVTFPLEQSE